MKKILITALALAAIGSQVANAASASQKVGVLSFALTDTIQGPSSKGVTDLAAPGHPKVTSTVPFLVACVGNYKYESSQAAVNNAAIFRAISSAWDPTLYFTQVGGSGNGVFTPKAKLVILNYDNGIPAPPYPPYLPELSLQNLDPLLPVEFPASQTFNGPRIPSSTPPTEWGIENYLIDWAFNNSPIDGMYLWKWPNLAQIDWVDYDAWADVDMSLPVNESLDPTVRPYNKALVYISDPTNVKPQYQCLNVSPFFSFEEAYCYFCWDTVDRVTDGTLSTGTTVNSEICIGSITSCGSKGSGTTRFYLTVKFNNSRAENEWLIRTVQDQAIRPWLIFDAFAISSTPYAAGATSKLSFTVGGVVNYPWAVKNMNGIRSVFGTMTMAQANGFASNPWCGVLRGSVTVTETTDLNIPVNCVAWQTPYPDFSGK
jgi:hypothetical protein